MAKTKKPEKKRAKIVCFSNHKGGVGKTCSTCNVGAALGNQGFKSLLIDLDPQANLSLSLGVKDPEQTIYKVMREEEDMKDIIYEVGENLSLVPSDLDLAGSEVEMVAELGRESILKRALKSVQDQFDYILIDCPPSFGLLATNAFTAADEVLIPIQSQYLSLQGVGTLTRAIYKAKRLLNENLEIGGVFVTQFNQQITLNKDIAKELDKHFKDKVFKTRIRNNVALAEAPTRGQDIFRYNPKSNGAQDYEKLTKEILKRHKQKVK